jgi:hypothetical protein
VGNFPDVALLSSAGGTITGNLTITGTATLNGPVDFGSTTSIVPPLAIESLSTLGIQAWNYPSLYTSASTPALASGRIYTMLVPLAYSITVTNILIGVQVAGATLTTAENWIGLYNSAGTLIGQSADQTTAWAGTGLITAALVSGPFAVSGSFCVVALVSNGTTCPQFSKAATGAPAPAIANLNATGANLLFAGNGTGTVLPGTLTYASANGANGQAMWVGLS